MIRLSRLNGKEFYLNCELIKYLESTPDTLVTLTTGEKLMVKESIEEIIAATLLFKRSMHAESRKPGPEAAGASDSRAPGPVAEGGGVF
jgi:flagellar protein FlbD